MCALCDRDFQEWQKRREEKLSKERFDVPLPNISSNPISRAQEATPPPPSKAKAEKAVKTFLGTGIKTAKEAARQINQSGWRDRMRATDHDNFNLSDPRYQNSGDYAEQAPDGRWVLASPGQKI